MGALDAHGLIEGAPVSAAEQVASAFDFIVRRVSPFVPPYPFQEHCLRHLEYERGARVVRCQLSDLRDGVAHFVEHLPRPGVNYMFVQ